MAGYRVQVDVHHNPDGPEGRPHMLLLNGWCVWHLSTEELTDLSAKALLSLAAARADMAEPIDAGHPDRPQLTEAVW